MPSNLPPITQNLSSGTQALRTEQLVTLSKLTGLSIGSTAMAVVEQIAPISQSQRDMLLAQNHQQLAQLQQRPPTPAITQQIANLMEQQQLLTSPPLKLVQLQFNNRTLLTYTDQPLQPGQQVPVKLDAQQRLVQLQTNLGNGSALPATNTGADQGIPAGKMQPVITRTEAQAALADALRTLLPQKEKPQDLLIALPQLQGLPVKQREQLMPATVQQALRSVADQLRSLPQLTNPKLLAMILKNSGVQLEQKLAATLFAPPAAQPAEKNPLPVASALPQRLIGQDFKGALLHLLHQLGRETDKAPSPGQVQDRTAAPVTPHASAPIPTQAPPPNVAGFAIPAPLQFPTALHLIQYLAARPDADLSDKVLRTQLMQLLHQHTLTSLAKVQLQQLHTLNHRQSQADNLQPTQSWLFDIPVRYGHEVHQLEIRIDQEWIADENKEASQQDKAKQWSVMLSFNLPRLGGLYTQLTILENTVSAKLWAEQESTLIQAQASLERLREQLQSQGVDVKQLQCLRGLPPNQSISLNYALVDVKT